MDNVFSKLSSNLQNTINGFSEEKKNRIKRKIEGIGDEIHQLLEIKEDIESKVEKSNNQKTIFDKEIYTKDLIKNSFISKEILLRKIFGDSYKQEIKILLDNSGYFTFVKSDLTNFFTTFLTDMLGNAFDANAARIDLKLTYNKDKEKFTYIVIDDGLGINAASNEAKKEG